MKTKILYLSTIALAILVLVGLSSCSEEKLNPKSVIIDSITEENDFDRWLMTAYVEPYNIDFKYRMEDIESDMSYNLIPAEYTKSVQMAKLLTHLCTQTYDEITGDKTFMRKYFPKIINLVGSPAYMSNGSVILGVAEGGRKITLYDINKMDVTSIEKLNADYFHTIHHEFAHILHQTKPYPKDYEAIVTGLSKFNISYVQDDCFKVYTSDAQAYKAGFITRYSAKADQEDFVEILSTYITNTPEQWAAKLATAATGAIDTGITGRTIIESKFGIVKTYMYDVWEIDIDELRSIVLRRQSEVPDLDLDNL